MSPGKRLKFMAIRIGDEVMSVDYQGSDQGGNGNTEKKKEESGVK
jgi:hypothetical protein